MLVGAQMARLAYTLDASGSKFAVASSAKTVCVCYYEADNNWWVAKQLKDHDGTVLGVAWHPNS